MAEEIADAHEFLKSQRESYAAAEKAVADKAAVATDQDTGSKIAETASAKNESKNESTAAELALADFCQALFCLNEFMYVE